MSRSELRLILTCRCQESSFLASESLDRKLTLSERLAMHLHHLACGRCLRVARHLRQIHALLADMPAAVRAALGGKTCALSPTAKTRIVESMRRQSQ